MENGFWKKKLSNI